MRKKPWSKDLKEVRGEPRGCLGGEKHSRQRKEPVQRPCGCSMLGVFKEQQGGPCGWNGVSEDEQKEVRTGRRWGQRVQGLMGRSKDFGFC